MGVAVAVAAQAVEECQLCRFLSVMQGECSVCELNRLRKTSSVLRGAIIVALAVFDNPESSEEDRVSAVRALRTVKHLTARVHRG